MPAVTLKSTVVFALGCAAGVLLALAIPGLDDEAAPLGAAAPPPDAGAETSARTDPTAESSPASGSRAEAATSATTLAEILELGSEFAQNVALYRLAGGAGIAEIERLIAEAYEVPGGVDRRAALSILYGRFADLDAGAAVDHVLSQRSVYEDVGIRAVFHAWSRIDLEAAVARAAELEPDLRQHAGAAILLSRHDLSRAHQEQIAGSLDLEHLLDRIAARQAMDAVQGNPEAAWVEAAAEPPGPARQQRLAGVLQVWARRDPLAALTAVQSLPEAGTRQHLLQQVVHDWSRRDPHAAVNWAMAQPASEQRAQFLAAGLHALAKSEPRAAFDLALGLAPLDASQAIGNVLSEWARVDHEAAAEALGAVTELRARRNAVQRIASRYVDEDPAGAVAWLLELGGQEAQLGLGLAFSMLGHRDPEQASGLLDDLPAGTVRDQATQILVRSWSNRDPAAAARWVDRMAPGEQRVQAGQVLAREWAAADPQAAIRYAESLPGQAEREAAIVGIIGSQGLQPALAESLYQGLVGDAHRREAARRLFFQFQGPQPELAERYREAAAFDEPGPRR